MDDQARNVFDLSVDHVAAAISTQYTCDGEPQVTDGARRYARAAIDALLPLVNRLRAEAAIDAVQHAAVWLEMDEEAGGAPLKTRSGVTLPERHAIALMGSTWAIESLDDYAEILRAAALTDVDGVQS